MKNRTFLIPILFSLSSLCAQYNPLRIPDTLSGKVFNLRLKDTFKQLRPGNQTITAGINGAFWGPTLIFNQGDTVRMNVSNKLNDSTTLHWHGFHLPAIMDGGPHQVIPPNTIWQPYWKVTNNASTFWYHPHLHEMTQEHMTKGLGGFIIVRDPLEAALAIPRTYGVDDIPLVLTSRRYDASNQFVYTNTAYGDYLLTNGTSDAEYTFPKQVVRLRVLNAETERGFILGFSDNRTFYVIGNDGGLLNSPVAMTRLPIYVGERYEILVNLSSDVVGTSIDLKAYNTGQSLGFPGGEPGTTGQFGSLLNNKDFTLLHMNIGASISPSIVSIPTSLVTNTYLTAADATVNRTVLITDGAPGPTADPFRFDNKLFDFSYINHTVKVNDIEKWSVTNNNVFGHCFHIHNVQFKILSRSSGAIGTHETGWKDNFFINRNETVSFVAKFDDYSDSIHPFMYHCHFANHEDEGMMGQFIVKGTTSTSGLSSSDKELDFVLYPNPTADKLYIKKFNPQDIYYITISDMQGRSKLMLPQADVSKGIDVSSLSKGVYLLRLTEKKSFKTSTQKFIVD